MVDVISHLNPCGRPRNHHRPSSMSQNLDSPTRKRPCDKCTYNAQALIIFISNSLHSRCYITHWPIEVSNTMNKNEVKKKTLKLYSAESIIIQYKNRYFNNVLKHMTNCLFINFTIHFFLQRHPSPMNRSCHLLVWTVLIFQWHYDFLHGRRIPIHTTTCPIHMTPIWWQPNHDLHLIPGTWIIRHITTPGCQWRKYTKERRDRVVIITKFLCDDLLLILEVWIFSAMT